MFSTEFIPFKTLKVIDLIAPFVDDFYLAGGTALSIYYGHRESEDLDFFTDKEFIPDIFLGNSRKNGVNVEKIQISPFTIHCILNDVKISFFRYDYPLIEPLNNFEKIKIGSVLDISSMKLAAILGRSEKKDYYDIYEILQHLTFEEIIRGFKKKFGGEVDLYQLAMAVEYFDDVENTPEPKRAKRTWTEVKTFLRKHSKEYLKIIESL